jgi:hypothetical protein
MVHLANGEAWSHFDGIHREKADEARNVHVVLVIDGFNPYGHLPHTHVGPCSLSPSIYPPCLLSMPEHILVFDNSWTPGE